MRNHEAGHELAPPPAAASEALIWNYVTSRVGIDHLTSRTMFLP